MAFSDWDFSSDNPSQLGIAVDLITPIIGTGSVRFTNPALVGTRRAMGTPQGTPFPNGFSQGRLRTLVRFSTSSQNQIGFVFLASHNDLAIYSGNYYFVGKGNASNWMTLLRGNNAKIGGIGETNTTTLVGPITTITFAVDTTYAFQADWIADDLNLGGTYVEFRVGTNTDFSNMTRHIAFLDDSVNRLSSGVTEGLGYFSNASTASVVRADETSLFSLNP